MIKAFLQELVIAEPNIQFAEQKPRSKTSFRKIYDMLKLEILLDWIIMLRIQLLSIILFTIYLLLIQRI